MAFPPDHMTEAAPAQRRRSSLTAKLQETLAGRIRAGELAVGQKLPTESAIMEEFAVSRTVVREAITRLQASGLVETRHGVGSFVLAVEEPGSFRIQPSQLGTLQEVIAVLELRIGVETEAAGLAAIRRTAEDLAVMQRIIAEFSETVEAGKDPVALDFNFHLQIARATRNHHFVELYQTLGTRIIPRFTLLLDGLEDAEARAYLHRVNAEHESIMAAIANQDSDSARAAMRTHLINSRDRRRRSSVAYSSS